MAPGVRRILLAAMLASFAGALGADPQESFKKGVAALDLEKWGEASEHLRAAVRENPRESADRVFLSGVFSRPYLPHFYLGWALYQGGLENCRDVLLALETSENQGVVQEFKRQYQNLGTARERCNEEVLPAAFEAASRELQNATRLAEQLAEPVADAELENDRSKALREIAAARQIVEASSDGARLSDLQAATRSAREAVELLEGVASQTSAAASQQLAVARAAARLEIEAAAEAERRLAELLADPERTPAWSGSDLVMPVDALARLDSARAGLEETADLAQVEQAQADARAAAASIARVRDRADEAYTRFVRDLQQKAERDASPKQPSVTPPPPVIRPILESESSAAPSVARQERLDEILRLRTLGSRLLGELGTEETNSELLETQKSRLTLLILEARERGSGDNSAGLEDLHSRLASSLAALQLVVGARAFLAGDMPRTVETLSNSPQVDDRLAAQAQLFLGAALHALYRAGGESDDEIVSRARAAVSACRELMPGQLPDARVFSPAFRAFFQAQAAQNR
ncbi:MAG: hypothetical protein AAF560_21500 [Acidobacteriota bacterium]